MSKLFIISGPSGAGEDSVVKGIKKLFSIEKIITTTTRKMRPGEINGKDYYFINKTEFEQKIQDGKFFEWTEEDNGQFYGGTLEEIKRVKNSGKIGIWKIEYQGVIAAKKLLPEAISIFIYISIDKIRQRLKNRENCSEEFIKARLEYAQGWFNNEDIFDYKVENIENKLDETIKKVANIIKNNIT